MLNKNNIQTHLIKFIYKELINTYCEKNKIYKLLYNHYYQLKIIADIN